MPKPVILIYSLKSRDLQKTIQAAMEYGVKIRPVFPSEYKSRLRELIGSAPLSQETEARAFYEGIIVMADFSNRLLSDFLNALKTRGVSRDIIRAVMTPVNAEWDSVTLHDELIKEHEAMKKAREKQRA